MDDQIQNLIEKRNALRASGKYEEADAIRAQLEQQGFVVTDLPESSSVIPKANNQAPTEDKAGVIALFGSGELSPTGRRIHEHLIHGCKAPVRIALLETPTGYEDNPHHWYQKMEKMLAQGLRNYKPIVTRVGALRFDGRESTNNPEIVKPLLEADYIHTGAGSPSYAVKHLKDSLALSHILDRLREGIPVSLASAASIAFGKYALPVYELYFVGEDPHWLTGLDVLSHWDLNLTVIPHWNNTEGGSDIDTRYAYMGQKRFDRLLSILPGPTTILGIDEQTACILNLEKREAVVLGNGQVTIRRGDKEQIFKNKESFPFSALV